MVLDVRHYQSVSSTMDVAAQALSSGAAEGLVIVADEQTAGRGRRGRAWSSPAGAGLYLSFILRPPPHPSGDTSVLALITLAAGVAVHAAIERASGLVAELKWPNDVMVGRRKLAGILAEGVAIGTPGQSIILGAGINVLRSSYPADVAERATSLETELDRAIDRVALLDQVLVSIPIWYGQLLRGDASDILRAWRAASPSAVGAAVEWNEGRSQGVTAGIDDSGALMVHMGDRSERITAGELRWV